MFALILQAAEDAAVEPDFILDVSWLSPLVGLFIPILVGMVTKANASPATKAVANIVLSTGGAYVSYLITLDGAFTVKDFFNQFVLVVIASWASYVGFWKPSGIGGRVQRATSGVGIGGSRMAA